MSAYSAVVCLEQLLSQFLNSDLLPKEDVVSFHGNISSLKSSLEIIFPAPKKYRDEANKLAIEIREKIFEAQDKIESFIFTQSHPPESETSKCQSSTSISLKEIAANIDPVVEKAKRLGNSIAEGKTKAQPVDESQMYKSSVTGQKTKIVGQDKYKTEIETKLTAVIGSRQIIPICGIPGIGKTTLAKSIYEDASFMKNFQYKAWVTVSQDANVGDILGKLLHSLESRGQKPGDIKYEGDEGRLRLELYQALYNNKYLVVIDDMRDQETWTKLQMALPDNQNRSRVLITTRISNLAHSIKSKFCLEMRPLGDEDSWTLLRNRTFGDDKECPPELVKHGKGIAINCKGLPLSITVIGGLLSQGRKETEYWRSIEEDTQEATSDAGIEDSSSGILSLSYDLLPCRLKGCFLYMAAFPQDSLIPVFKLIMLWVAEGFLTATPSQLVEKVAEQSLLELIERNLVIIRKSGSDGQIKSCGMDSSLRELAEKEARKDMFFHLRKRHLQKVEQGTNAQRRVSVHKNILMCLEHVYDSTKKIKKARSLLCVGPHHHHPMPFNLTFDLLRVLDAFTFFFIQFPEEILKLIHLRYLSLTYNGKLPSKIAKLHRLQVLIVKRLPKIIYVGTSFLPDEIWNMKELRHILITETDMPLLSPIEPAATIFFENLQTLSNVSADSCTQEVLGHMPNLKRLTMWVEAPGKVGLYLNKLNQLEVFKLTVLDPIPGEKIDFQPKLFFSDTIKKLSLSGCGLPWDDMVVIAKLPNLEMLKLKEFAFHGDEWYPNYTFKKLKFLLMEDLNLKWWEADSCIFPHLEQLIVRHCYDLKEIPSNIGELMFLRMIELVDCSPDVGELAEYIKAEQQEVYGKDVLQVRVYSSWD